MNSDPRLDARAASKRIGLVVLATDHTIEPDFHRICPAEDLNIHANRILNDNPITPDSLKRMRPHLSAAASLILPDETLDVICYGCTSASTVLGDQVVTDAIQSAKPGTPVVNPALAGRTALTALGARRISLLVPYVSETGAQVRRYFEEHGIAVDRLTCMEIGDDRDIARVNPSYIKEAATSALDPASDALFISCTALRAAPLIETLESSLQRPVVTSNQASAWLCLRLIGRESAAGFGRLMGLSAPLAQAPN